MKPEVRTRIAELLGLGADASDDDILKRMQEKLDKSAESAVSAAVRSGKILAAHQDFWLSAFQKDHRGTKAVLESLASARRIVATAPSVSTPIAPYVTNGYTPQAVSTQAPNVSAQTMSDAQADAELWAMGCRGSIEEPPKPKWYELFPPKQV